MRDGRDSPAQERMLRFRQCDHQLCFERDGFVKVPFLEAAQLEELTRLWDEVGPSEVGGIYSNIHDLEPPLNRRIDESIRRIFATPASSIFDDAELGGASFLVKGTGARSASTPHQDWNNVEEDITQSASIWVPLIDVDESNGALQVIPGSHRVRRSIRSLDTPSLYLDFDDRLEPLLQCVPARAGEAVVYAHNLFHGSKVNPTGTVRVSAVAGVVRTGTRLVHRRRVDGSTRNAFEMFEVDNDFFFSGVVDMAAGRVPSTARSIGTLELPGHELTFEDVEAAACRGRGVSG